MATYIFSSNFSKHKKVIIFFSLCFYIPMAHNSSDDLLAGHFQAINDRLRYATLTSPVAISFSI